MGRLAFLLVLLPLAASACECVLAPVCERMRSASIVFWGETISGGLNPQEDAWSGRPTSATLKVLEAYRLLDKDQETLEISLSFWKGMCSAMPYRRGARTLVFLHSPRALLHPADGLCTLSLFADEGDRELTLVRRYFAGAPTTIVGTVWKDRESYMASTEPIEAARVYFVGKDGVRRSVLTSADGSYEIIGLPPGRYRLWATKAKYDSRREGSMIVDLAESGCAIADLSLWTKD